MTLGEYRVMLGWSPSELARRAGVSTRTINRIEDGRPTYDYTLGAIVRVISAELGRTVTINDLEGANIIRTT
ncbi:MAG TPA: helix-turn-helix domain-containing protein [Ktedonobacteraceae bacterium]|nr:helix-turn-helix domain-containing protein [Ktedonobacteraceae bacterium]